MRPAPHHRTRLVFLVVSALVAGLAVRVVGLGLASELALAALAGGAGAALGTAHWRRILRRIDRRNFVILYSADGLAYLLLVTLFLFKFIGLFRVAGLMWRNAPVFEGLLLGTAWLVAGYNLALFLSVRGHERRHGPLSTRRFYSRSVTGAEGMIGLEGTVRAACRPEGTVEVRGEIWSAVAADERLPPGTAVRIVDIDELRLVVDRPERGCRTG